VPSGTTHPSPAPGAASGQTLSPSISSGSPESGLVGLTEGSSPHAPAIVAIETIAAMSAARDRFLTRDDAGSLCGSIEGRLEL